MTKRSPALPRLPQLRQPCEIPKRGCGHQQPPGRIAAGLLNVKLDFLDALNAERREIARRYLDGLDTARLTLPGYAPA